MQIAAVSDSNAAQGGNGISSGSQTSDGSFQQAMLEMLALLGPASAPPLQTPDGSGSGKAPLSAASGLSLVAPQMNSVPWAGSVPLNQAQDGQQGSMPSAENTLPDLLATLALQQNPEQVAQNIPSTAAALLSDGQSVQPGSQTAGVPNPGNNTATALPSGDTTSMQPNQPGSQTAVVPSPGNNAATAMPSGDTTFMQSNQSASQAAGVSSPGNSTVTAVPSGDTTSMQPNQPASQTAGVPGPGNNPATAMPSGNTTSMQLILPGSQASGVTNPGSNPAAAAPSGDTTSIQSNQSASPSAGVPSPGNSTATGASLIDLTTGQPPNQPTSPGTENTQAMPMSPAVIVQAGTGTAQVAVYGNIQSGKPSQAAPSPAKNGAFPTQQNSSDSQGTAETGFLVAQKANLPVTGAPTVQPENKDASGNGSNDGTATGGGKVPDNALQAIAVQTGAVTQTFSLDESPKNVALPDLSDRLLQEIKQFSKISQGEGQTQIQFKLEPEQLGELTIKLVFNRGELSAHFYTANSQVKEVLDGSMQQLKHSLGQQDLKLNEALVFVGGGNTGDAGPFYRENSGNRASVRGWLNRFGNRDASVQPLEASAKEVVSGSVNYLI